VDFLHFLRPIFLDAFYERLVRFLGPAKSGKSGTQIFDLSAGRGQASPFGGPWKTPRRQFGIQKDRAEKIHIKRRGNKKREGEL